jgi:hypothetical protein
MPLLGAESVVPLELDVFPNPAHVYIQINTEPGAQLEITNLQGNLVLNKTLHNWINFVDVSDLVSSTYIVRVMYEGKVAMRKVMVGSR